MEAQGPKAENLSGCLLRVFWMVIGNLGLFFSAYFIAAGPAGGQLRFSWLDAVYGGTVLALLLVRYVDVRCCNGTTVTGAPATTATFGRYALVLLGVSLATWAGVHAVSYLR